MCEINTSDKKSEAITFKVTKNERDKLDLMSNLVGMTLTDLIRDAICKTYGDKFDKLDAFVNDKSESKDKKKKKSSEYDLAA